MASANASQGTAAKDEALAMLVDLMKTNIRYAENTARGENGKLRSERPDGPKRGGSVD